jgi:hypothetical protein
LKRLDKIINSQNGLSGWPIEQRTHIEETRRLDACVAGEIVANVASALLGSIRGCTANQLAMRCAAGGGRRRDHLSQAGTPEHLETDDPVNYFCAIVVPTENR